MRIVEQVDCDDEAQFVQLSDRLAEFLPRLLAQHHVDESVELRELPHEAQLGSDRLEALLDVARPVGAHRVDAHLHVREPGGVEAPDERLGEQEAVRRDGDLCATRAVGHDFGQVGMQERLAAQERDVHDAQPVQDVNAPLQRVERNHLRDSVILGAVAAAQVAAPRDDELDLDRRTTHHEIERGPERVGDSHDVTPRLAGSDSKTTERTRRTSSATTSGT